jgi:hypothetical protein
MKLGSRPGCPRPTSSTSSSPGTWSGATSTRDSARIHRVAGAHTMGLNTAIGIDKVMIGMITAEPTWACSATEGRIHLDGLAV